MSPIVTNQIHTILTSISGGKAQNIAIYAANRNQGMKGEPIAKQGFPVHRVLSVYNLTAVPETGMEVIALKEPIFAAMFLLVSNHEWYIEEFFMFGMGIRRELSPNVSLFYLFFEFNSLLRFSQIARSMP